MEKHTMDGVPYYYNSASEAVSWDKPDALKDEYELESDSGEWRWIRDDEYGYIPAKTVETNEDGTIECVDDDGVYYSVKKEDLCWPLFKTSLLHLQEDLVLIDNMNEGLILYNLRKRFEDHKIYTNIGTILISVNPYQRLPLYTPSMIDKYYHSGGNKKLPPHIFGIADAAYKDLTYGKRNQSILISGESGAGKTEATKQCLSFFAEVAGSETNVEQKIIQANPILEGFGNAKTVRNNNSSRFGKYMEVHFNKKGQIVGAKVENYLLEKTRVTFQAEGERNYHIFFQLCLGCMSEKYGLNPDLSFYRYLRGADDGSNSVDDIDDSEEFDQLLESMDILGFTEEERDFLFSVTAGVLLLGNVQFVKDERVKGVAVKNKGLIGKIAKLFRVQPQVLDMAVTSRTFRIRGQEPTKIPFKKKEAMDACDALAKSIYGRVFDWLVQRVNSACKIEGSSDGFIGVLDIFGFEIFENNSFEQLCINFANEKLQQHFNQYTFKLEEKMYMSEKIKFDHIEFIDNQPILDLIEKRPNGLLVLLDEECVFPKATDLSFCQKIRQRHSQGITAEYFKPVLKKDTDFDIIHYAGAVRYDGEGFLDKNRDILHEDLQNLMSTSGYPVLAELFPAVIGDDAGRKSGKSSLGGQFRNQLSDLMQKLNTTDPHYVRCVKPNSSKSPEEFNSVMSLEQLRYAGVFEAISIRQQGFPFRYDHEEFIRRFKCITLKEDGWIPLKSKKKVDMCKEIMAISKQDFSGIQIGRTRILYRSQEQRVLELLRNLSLERVSVKIQAFLRGCTARDFSKKLLQARPVLRDALDVRTDLEKVKAALDYTAECIGSLATILTFQMKEVTDCRELQRQLEERKRVTELCRAVFPLDPEVNFDRLTNVVAQADAVADYPGTPEQLQIYKDTKDKLQLTIDRRSARKMLADGTKFADKFMIDDAIERAVSLGISDCAEVGKAKQELDRIAEEERVLAELLSSLDNGKCIRWSPDAQNDIDTSVMAPAIKTALDFGMRTSEGVEALEVAQFVLPLRQALQRCFFDGCDAWPQVESITDTAEFEMLMVEEVAWAVYEVNFRAKLREVHEPLKAAAAEMNESLMEEFLAQIDAPRPLGHDQERRLRSIEAELVPEMKAVLANITRVRQLLEKANASAEEASLQEAIAEATNLPVTSSVAAHLEPELVVAELQLGTLVHFTEGTRQEVGLMLDDTMAGATKAEIRTSTGGSEVLEKNQILTDMNNQLTILDKAIAHAQSVELTEQGKAVLAKAVIISALRKALLNRDWDSVEATLNQAGSLQMHNPEVLLGRDEVAGRALASDVLAKLEAATKDIATPCELAGHPSEGILETSLAQAERLEMKELDTIVQARNYLNKILTTRQALQDALVQEQYEEHIPLAEGFEELYSLLQTSQNKLKNAIAMAEEFSYETLEVSDARNLLAEFDNLYRLQNALQTGGYYDENTPSAPPPDSIVVDTLKSTYNPNQAPITKLGRYITTKCYHLIAVREAVYFFCENYEGFVKAVEAASMIGFDTVELVSARALLKAVTEARDCMQQAEDTVVEATLIEAINLCEALFYENDDVSRVRDLRDTVIQLNEESRQALWIMDKDRMQAVLEKAQAIRLNTPHFDRIEGMLSMDREGWLKLELKKAKELDDEPRKIRLGIMLKQITLTMYEKMFTIDQLRTLRTAEDFANAKMVALNKKKLVQGFLHWSKTPIHTSLTKIEDPIILKEAKKCFKNILGYMLDKKYSYPTTLAQELINSGLTIPELRSEIYCQLIKQLTDHPVPQNQAKGWDLMALCVSHFPPGDDMANVLEIFLRKAPSLMCGAYLSYLCDVTYGPLKQECGSADELDAFVKRFHNEKDRVSDFEVPKPLKEAPYTEAFFQDPSELFLATETDTF